MLAVIVTAPVPVTSTQPPDTWATVSSLEAQVRLSASTLLPCSSVTPICVPLPFVTSVFAGARFSSFGPSQTRIWAVAVMPLGAVTVTLVSPAATGVICPLASTVTMALLALAKVSSPVKFSGTTV